MEDLDLLQATLPFPDCSWASGHPSVEARNKLINALQAGAFLIVDRNTSREAREIASELYRDGLVNVKSKDVEDDQTIWALEWKSDINPATWFLAKQF